MAEQKSEQASLEESVYIPRRLAAIKRRTRQALSPWVRRRLGSGGVLPAAGARPERGQTAGSRRRASLTVGHTERLLGRVRRTVDRARLWKPGVGSLNPALVDRFVRTIHERRRPMDLIGIRRQAPVQEVALEDEQDLVLPVGPPSALSAAQAQQRGTTGTTIAGPSVFSVGQVIPPLSSAPRPRPSPPRKPAPARPRRQPPRRRFSRIEEVTSHKPEGSRPGEPPGAPIQHGPAKAAEREAEPSPGQPVPPAGDEPVPPPDAAPHPVPKSPSVQRKAEAGEAAPSAAKPGRVSPGEPDADGRAPGARETPPPSSTGADLPPGTEAATEAPPARAVTAPGRDEEAQAPPRARPAPGPEPAPARPPKAGSPSRALSGTVGPGIRPPKAKLPSPRPPAAAPPSARPLPGPAARGSRPLPGAQEPALGGAQEVGIRPGQAARPSPSLPVQRSGQVPPPAAGRETGKAGEEPRRRAAPPVRRPERADTSAPVEPAQPPKLGSQPPPVGRAEPAERSPGAQPGAAEQSPRPAAPAPSGERGGEGEMSLATAAPGPEPSPEPGPREGRTAPPPTVEGPERPAAGAPEVPRAVAPEQGRTPDVQRQEDKEMPLRVPPPKVGARPTPEAEALPGSEPAGPQPPGPVERRSGPRTGPPPSRPREARPGTPGHPGPPSPPQRETGRRPTAKPSPSPRPEERPEVPEEPGLPPASRRDADRSPAAAPPVSPGEHGATSLQAPSPQESGRGQVQKGPVLSKAEGPALSKAEGAVIQRQTEERPAGAATPPAEPPSPWPPSLLGREIRVRAAARTRMPLVARALRARRVQAGAETAAAAPSPARALLRPVARTPGLYHRTPDRHVGPDPSLALLSAATRRASAPSSGTTVPGAGADSLEALLAAWELGPEETMVLPPPRMGAPVSQPAPQAGPSRAPRPAPGQAGPRLPPREPAPARQIQRHVTAPATTPLVSTSPAPPDVVQRALGEDVGGEEDEVDLRDLARRVLPIVKRMLAIERERRPDW
jgi:hypothetical protein